MLTEPEPVNIIVSNSGDSPRSRQSRHQAARNPPPTRAAFFTLRSLGVALLFFQRREAETVADVLGVQRSPHERPIGCMPGIWAEGHQGQWRRNLSRNPAQPDSVPDQRLPVWMGASMPYTTQIRRRVISDRLLWRHAAFRYHLRFHDLHHSAASAMINAKVDLYTVGAVLGHRSAQSTQRYAHLATDSLRDALSRIGAKPAKKSPASKKQRAA